MTEASANPPLMRWPGHDPRRKPSAPRSPPPSTSFPLSQNSAAAKLPERKIDGHDICAPHDVEKRRPGVPHAEYVLMHGPGTVRSGKWKFYPWKEGKGGQRNADIGNTSDEPVQLYDTVADIGETKNLAAKHPEVVKRLQAAYDAHLAEIKANQRPTAELKRPEGAHPSTRPGGQRKKPAKKPAKKAGKKAA